METLLKIEVKKEFRIPEYKGSLEGLAEKIISALPTTPFYSVYFGKHFIDFVNYHLNLNNYFRGLKSVHIPENVFLKLVLRDSIPDIEIVTYAEKELQLTSWKLDPITALWTFYFLTSQWELVGNVPSVLTKNSKHNVIGYFARPSGYLFGKPVLTAIWDKEQNKWQGILFPFHEVMCHIEGEIVLLPKRYSNPILS